MSELVDDANELVWAAEDLDLLDPQAVDAVALLALVAGQDVEPGDRPGQWRIAKGTTPDRVLSDVAAARRDRSCRPAGFARGTAGGRPALVCR